jgi:soluble lytic murein transglycosylase
VLLALAAPAGARKAPKTQAIAPIDAKAARALGEAWAAFRAGDHEQARELAEPLLTAKLRNADYALWIAAQAAFLGGDAAAARPRFEKLAAQKGSRFAAGAAWRAADCLWEEGKRAQAAAAYQKLLGKAGGDASVARFRIAEHQLAAGKKAAGQSMLRKLATSDPSHPLASRAVLLLDPPLTARERITRAANLTMGRGWTEALVELSYVKDDEPVEILRLRDFWTGETLFKMRRQYARAGKLLLSVYQDMGPLAAQALFHGARALSRAHDDDAAIKWYAVVVEKYPRTDFAAEAQFLMGWLEYNRGRFREALPALEGLLQKYPRSKWADDALWFTGFSHYMLGEYEQALSVLERIAKQGGELEGGKGLYWKARTLWHLGREADGVEAMKLVVARWPLSWYALLARARLAEKGIDVEAFPGGKGGGGALAAPDEKLASDPAVARADELIAAGLTAEAAWELRRGELALIKKHGRAKALPVLFDRYARAENWNRPWALSETFGGGAIRRRPEGAARAWWIHAHPEAYKQFVDKYQDTGKNPPYYIYCIMKKESGFNPHDVSYADAIGLLQMIPPTTRRVAPRVGLTYAPDLLYDPELNVRVGAWYIGGLYAKFKQQIPISAGSYNGGPKAMMRWLDAWGDKPMDEFVELVSYRESREYMKKVAGIYARYLYLYEGKVYEQPLTVDRKYLVNDLDY